MSEERVEQDGLGARRIPRKALHGIHTVRAHDNFPLARRPVSAELVHAYGAVKLAAAQTNHELGLWSDDVFDAITGACREMMEGTLDEHVLVDALQGGAGTSTNMNVNEVLANRALQRLGHLPGRYDVIHPIDDINRHQSTNDTYPTALRIAAIRGIRQTEQSIVTLQEAFQLQEKAMADVIRVARTEMQDAVLTTMGRQMSAYAEPISRDRWRIYKCEERLRVVNLGGTAIGTGITAPRDYIFRVVEKLKHVTGIGLARAENLVEATQNADVFVEVSGMLSACAVTLIKICSDLRLLSSGPDAGLGEIQLPVRQTGSSLMPGKVNPVIPEAVTQAALVVNANHGLIAQAAAMGSLELNAFMPLIADRLLESIGLLTRGCALLAELCIQDMHADVDRCRQYVDGATATLTALVDVIGYDNAERLAHEARQSGESIRETAIASHALSAEDYDAAIAPESVMRLGRPGGILPVAGVPEKDGKEDE